MKKSNPPKKKVFMTRRFPRSPEGFGKALVELRKELQIEGTESRGVSQKKLAELAAMNRTAVNDIEAGRRAVGVKVLKRLATALELEEREAEQFVLAGLAAASKRHRSKKINSLPPEMADLLVAELERLVGSSPVSRVYVNQTFEDVNGAACRPDVAVRFEDETWATLELKVSRKLSLKLKSTAEEDPEPLHASLAVKKPSARRPRKAK